MGKGKPWTYQSNSHVPAPHLIYLVHIDSDPLSFQLEGLTYDI